MACVAFAWAAWINNKPKRLGTRLPYLYKTTSKEFEYLHKSYATAAAMATRRFKMADILALM
jgi:hypothetical protein